MPGVASKAARSAKVPQLVASTPAPLSGYRNARPGVVPPLGRPLVVAVPCCGIDGCGFALKDMEVPHSAAHVFDLEQGYADLLQHHLGEFVVGGLRVGKEKGDVLRPSLASFKGPCDGLVSGPPCPPWSAQGSRGGAADPRADVFLRVLELVIKFIKEASLQFTVLENVVGILHKIAGESESFGEKVLLVLGQEAPEFSWSFRVLESQDYGLPTLRKRCFLVGFRAPTGAANYSVPPPLPHFPATRLEESLGDFPPTPLDSLTHALRKNLSHYEGRVRALLLAKQVEPHDVISFSLDRGPGKVYAAPVHVNVVPTFTTHNKYIFVMRCGEVAIPQSQRKLSRYLAPTERLTLQGFPKEIAGKVADEALCVQAAGNSYPTALLAANLDPLFRVLAQRHGNN
ncbi:unnamed protein product [Prorocentrum cordatum]|uniref:DNA (cytosine-5-)-methyltransferase n=1 Tax=Prorocentrum cordatum TaxID=2364126 RepID=A0ABN9PRY0_9DINO|nr:unnamed protein product [Polarella glacialis]